LINIYFLNIRSLVDPVKVQCYIPTGERQQVFFIFDRKLTGKLYIMQKILLAIIRAYQLVLSPFLGQHCRFTPSCSQYTQEAIRKYGAARGSWLGFKRIIRCQPFCDGGHDPVP
jgi:putative membrane protein insertion efficiency factor